MSNDEYYSRDEVKRANDTWRKLKPEQKRKILDLYDEDFFPPDAINRDLWDWGDEVQMSLAGNINDKYDLKSRRMEEKNSGRCPIGYVYVKGHYQGEIYIKGFCRKKAK